MDRVTRKELKTDRFAVEVEHTVEYVSEHRRQMIVYGGIAVVVILAIVAYTFFSRRQHAIRQATLQEAISIQQAAIGPAPSPLIKSFNTKAEKDQEAEKAFRQVIEKHPGSEEASYAAYMLGNIAMDQGKMAEAEKRYKEVAESGHDNYASIAKLSLAEMYDAQGKNAEAEKLLRELIDSPTALVSKEQATIVLARVLADSKPEEARKLIEPLRTSDRNAISRSALTLSGQLSATAK
ncbi:MAG: tetratricopeptide repeat protein [Bryobacteraceae bacterium]|nr:tetratricopeptide repeat protein [Bryobacteraceae bacterium]